MKNSALNTDELTYEIYKNTEEKSAYRPVIDRFSKKGSFKNTLFDCFKSVKIFILRAWDYFFVSIFILLIFGISLAVNDVYPFGKNAMAGYDMLAQVSPFIEHLFDVFEGKSSLFYSTAISGGTDVFGTMAYCMISPFTWIFLLFGKGNVYYGVGIVLPLKLIFVSFAALYFLHKQKNIPKPIAALFSLLYAFSGYTFVANTYINWVDLMIYMPFVAINYKKLVETGKIWGFAISYALMIYTCFSLSSFAMLLVFLIIFCYGVIVKHPNKKEVLAKSCLGLLLAVGLSLPVMVPSFIAYLSSKRSTGLFENLFANLNATHLYRKITYIVSDATFLFLMLVYFIKNGFKRPIDRFLFITGVILLMPILVDECCNLLNGGSYLSYSLRFGFLNAFYELFIAARLVSESSLALTDKKVDTDGITPRLDGDRTTLDAPSPLKDNLLKAEKAKSLRNNIIFGTALTLIAVGAILYLVFSDKVIELVDKIYKKTDESYSYEFYSVFAHSLGGLEVIGPYAVILAILFSVALLFYKKRLCGKEVISIILCVVMAAQLSFYGLSLVKGNLYDTKYYDGFNQMVNLINGENVGADNNDLIGDVGKGATTTGASEYYRIKDTEDAFTACLPLATHTNSFGVFSSVADRRNFTATDFFDYRGNGINSAKSAGGMFLGDMLLGYKYYVFKNEGDNADISHVDRYYLEKLDGYDKNGLSAYKNNAVFPTAFTVKGKDLDFKGLSLAQKYDKLYNFLGGNGSLYDEYDLELTDSYDTDITKLDDGVIKISVRIRDKDCYWFLSTDFSEDCDVRYCRTGVYDDGDAVKLEKGGDILFSYYKYSSAAYVATLKDYSKKLTVEDVKNHCKVYGISAKKIYNPYDGDEEVYDAVWKNKADFTIKNGNTFNITANAADDGTYLFLSFVALDGHKAYVNGKEAQFIDNGLDLMLLKLDKGENNVVIKYRSPYIKYAVFGLIGALLVCASVIFILKSKRLKGFFNTAIYYMAIVLFIAVLGFFIIFPTAVFLVKFVKLIIGLF